MFYIELSSLLDDLATLAEPVFVSGDFNIRLVKRRLLELFETYGLTGRVNAPTHDLHGPLELVATRENLVAPEVNTIDIGFSDHLLVR